MSKSIKSYDYIILGAGAAGLSLARALLDRGVTSLLVLEKEKDAGGLCRSKIVDNAPLDIGGGHILDVTRVKALDFLFRFLPKDNWNKFKRCTKIEFQGHLIDFPIESNIWQLPSSLQVKHLISLFKASANSSKKAMPVRFDKWVHYKYGEEIALNYMIPYNKKLWGKHFNRLNTSWLHKLPNVDFEETLLSCLEKSSYGKIPAHANFYYPKVGGFGLLWEKIAQSIDNKLLLETPVMSFDYKNKVINNRYKAKCIINTIPWPILSTVSDFPSPINKMIRKLRSIPLKVDYFKDNTNSPAHWTYIPDENISHHRIVQRHNIVPNSCGYWTETNATRKKEPTSTIFSITNEYAYPVNVFGKDAAISSILNWGGDNDIFGFGRWGTWDHINADVVVEKALTFANKLVSN